MFGGSLSRASGSGHFSIGSASARWTASMIASSCPRGSPRTACNSSAFVGARRATSIRMSSRIMNRGGRFTRSANLSRQPYTSRATASAAAIEGADTLNLPPPLNGRVVLYRLLHRGGEFLLRPFEPLVPLQPLGDLAVCGQQVSHVVVGVPHLRRA